MFCLLCITPKSERTLLSQAILLHSVNDTISLPADLCLRMLFTDKWLKSPAKGREIIISAAMSFSCWVHWWYRTWWFVCKLSFFEDRTFFILTLEHAKCGKFCEKKPVTIYIPSQNDVINTLQNRRRNLNSGTHGHRLLWRRHWRRSTTQTLPRILFSFWEMVSDISDCFSSVNQCISFFFLLSPLLILVLLIIYDKTSPNILSYHIRLSIFD